MSEQIREQVSAFLDGELPNSETELLLKRLTRDGELRESFGRYALIGEAIRGTSQGALSKGFTSRVNLAIDGEPVTSVTAAPQGRAVRWWRPLAGTAVAASVAAIAIVALQQRATLPAPITAQVAPLQTTAVANREALSYTVPTTTAEATAMRPPTRLTNYVFAHSKYSSGLGQRGVLADLLIDDEDQPAAVTPPAPDTRVAP